MSKEKTVTKKTETQEHVHEIPITDIFCDDTWNARSGNWQKDEEFTTLVGSVKIDGKIHSPIEVRPTPKDSDKTEPYSIIAGFRRYHAAINNEFKTIPCIIKDVTESAARLRNIQENSVRENLRTQDQCYAIGLLKGRANQQEIAETCGLSQPYVGKLIKIYDNLKPNIFNTWRVETNIKIPVTEIMSLASLPKDQQDQAFSNLIKSMTEHKGGKGKSAWLDAATRKVAAIGFTVGRLARSGLVGHIEMNSSLWEERDVQGLVKLAKDVTSEQVNSLVLSFLAGVTAGQQKDEVQKEPDPIDLVVGQ